MIDQQLHCSSTPLFLSSAKTAFTTSAHMKDLPIFTNTYVTGFSETYPQKVRATGSVFSNGNRHRSSSLSSTEDEDASTGPLPGGCHARTGSAQAYCQRLPCHKNSGYCKRHYQQYVVEGGSKATTSKKTKVVEEKTSHSRSSSSSSSSQQQQDKRYSGAKGETRCKATTTRGRECAYIAVDGTKYCHMHADYDTNPPPRRGGKHASVVTEAPKSKKKEAQRAVPNVSDSSTKSSDRKRRNTAEKLAQKHADSPYPLLSMISSDQWANKRVRVAVGPFEGHVGNVEKWSNGWVGVRIANVGLHNRRSFELYLDNEEEVMEELPLEQQKAILRCVSRDAVTPSPLPNGKRTPSPKSTTSTSPSYQPVTPNPTMDDTRVISKNRNLNGLDMVSLPEVTPLEAPRACVNSPVIESLLASQDRNDKLDLFFGTAAFDRSRRNIRRPKIYEDTEMLDKKRSRKVSLGLDE